MWYYIADKSDDEDGRVNLLSESRGWCEPGSKPTQVPIPSELKVRKLYASRHLPKMLRKCKALKEVAGNCRNLSGTAGIIYVYMLVSKNITLGRAFFMGIALYVTSGRQAVLCTEHGYMLKTILRFYKY